MSEVSAAFAKLAGIGKAIDHTLNDEFKRRGERPYQNFPIEEVAPLFTGAVTAVAVLRAALPDLYGDFHHVGVEPNVQMSNGAPPRYGRPQLEKLRRDLIQIFEIRANSELSEPAAPRKKEKPCVFMSHGRAEDWRAVQAYIERDLGIDTKELAQEPNLGRTVLGKLSEVSDSCDAAVIVMTGDDLDAEGQARARENVLHEIGYFQGRYGLNRVCLLHEEGVNIPSNIHGLVYTPFTKGKIEATFGLLARELNAIYERR
jgi:predicted nucleotide-binding protein